MSSRFAYPRRRWEMGGPRAAPRPRLGWRELELVVHAEGPSPARFDERSRGGAAISAARHRAFFRSGFGAMLHASCRARVAV